MSIQFEKDFDKAFSFRDDDVEIDRVFSVTLSDDMTTVDISEECDRCFGTTASREQFQQLIFAMQRICDRMTP